MLSRIITCASHDPFYNLAVEEALLDACCGEAILMLWQNAHTVVIGRHQNAWKECDVALLQAENGNLARRITGGGAVYHDLGNLNFSLIVPSEVFDERRQSGVLLAAVQAAGAQAMRSGRNDLEAEGRKFSGHAYCHRERASLHHGTLLVDTDFEKLGRYLSPGELKLRSRSVDSVRSRVINLAELCPGLTAKTLADLVGGAFEAEYGTALRQSAEEALDDGRVSELTARNRLWDYRLGRSPRGSANIATRFTWGGVELYFQVENGRIVECSVYSDAMDEAFIEALPGLLRGKRLSGDELRAALSSYPTPHADELALYLKEHF